ncbi:uncharacterized protein TM35_000021610, partial [Trypanosoma theileri]
ASAAVEPLTQITSEEATAPAVTPDTIIRSAPLHESVADADRDAVEPLTQSSAEEGTLPSQPQGVSVSSGNVVNLLSGVRDDTHPPLSVAALSAVDTSNEFGNVSGSSRRRSSSAYSPVVSVSRGNVREDGGSVCSDMHDDDIMDQKSLSFLNAMEDVARSSRSKRVVAFGSSPPSGLKEDETVPVRRVFTEMYPDKNFLSGTDRAPLVLIGKAHECHLSTGEGVSAVNEIFVGNELLTPTPVHVSMMSAVEESPVKPKKSRSPSSGGGRQGSKAAEESRSTSRETERPQVRFASSSMVPTPPQVQQRPIRVRRNYDTYRGLSVFPHDLDAVAQRAVIHPYPPSAGKSTTPTHSEFSPQQRGNVPSSATQQRQSGYAGRSSDAPVSTSHRVIPQAVQTRLPIVPISPAQRDALYRHQRVHAHHVHPTPAPPRGQTSAKTPGRGANANARGRTAGPASGSSQTGRFMGRGTDYYY